MQYSMSSDNSYQYKNDFLSGIQQGEKTSLSTKKHHGLGVLSFLLLSVEAARERTQFDFLEYKHISKCSSKFKWMFYMLYKTSRRGNVQYIKKKWGPNVPHELIYTGRKNLRKNASLTPLRPPWRFPDRRRCRGMPGRIFCSAASARAGG